MKSGVKGSAGFRRNEVTVITLINDLVRAITQPIEFSTVYVDNTSLAIQ